MVGGTRDERSTDTKEMTLVLGRVGVLGVKEGVGSVGNGEEK